MGARRRDEGGRGGVRRNEGRGRYKEERGEGQVRFHTILRNRVSLPPKLILLLGPGPRPPKDGGQGEPVSGDCAKRAQGKAEVQRRHLGLVRPFCGSSLGRELGIFKLAARRSALRERLQFEQAEGVSVHVGRDWWR